MTRRRSLILSCLLLPGCLAKPAEWREFDTPAVPFEEVWRTVLEKAQMNGFFSQTSGDESTDRGLRVFRSRWVTREYGFRNTSRRRMEANFEPSSATAGGWLVRLRIERQTVTDIAKSMNPEDRDWKSDGQDSDAESRIIAQVKMQLGMKAITPRERGR